MSFNPSIDKDLKGFVHPNRCNTCGKNENWERDDKFMSEKEALVEARRCMKCADVIFLKFKIYFFKRKTFF